MLRPLSGELCWPPPPKERLESLDIENVKGGVWGRSPRDLRQGGRVPFKLAHQGNWAPASQLEGDTGEMRAVYSSYRLFLGAGAPKKKAPDTPLF